MWQPIKRPSTCTAATTVTDTGGRGGGAAAASTDIVVVLRLNSGFETAKKGLKKKI